MIDIIKLVRIKKGEPVTDPCGAAIREHQGRPNLLDVKSSNIKVGKYISNSGSETTGTGHFYCTAYIAVSPSTTYAFTTNPEVYAYRIIEYDSGKTFKKANGQSKPAKTFSLKTQSTTSYVRIGANIDNTTCTEAKVLGVRWLMREKG